MSTYSIEARVGSDREIFTVIAASVGEARRQVREQVEDRDGPDTLLVFLDYSTQA